MEGGEGQITIQFIAKFFPFGQKTHMCVRCSFWIFKASQLTFSMRGHARYLRASLVTQMVKNTPAMQETPVRSRG